MENCNQDIFTPTNDQPVLCDGKFYSTECILTPNAIPYINIPVNASQQQINTNLVLALQQANVTIQQLSQRIDDLENP